MEQRSILETCATHFNDLTWGGEGGLEAVFADFVEKHADTFIEAAEAKRAGQGCEHSLEFTELHNEYKLLIEGSVGAVVQAEGRSTSDLYRECKEAVSSGRVDVDGSARAEAGPRSDGKEDDDNDVAWFVRSMLAASSYSLFFDVMVEAAEEARGRRRQSRHESKQAKK